MDFRWAVGVPPWMMLGLVRSRWFLLFAFTAYRSEVFFNRFILTRFLPAPDPDPDPTDLPDTLDLGLTLLLASDGAFSLDPTLLTCLLFGPLEYNLFDISLILVFFLACSIYCCSCLILARWRFYIFLEFNILRLRF